MKIVHPAVCSCVLHYNSIKKSCAQGQKSVHPALKMCTPGAGCTFGLEHCIISLCNHMPNMKSNYILAVSNDFAFPKGPVPQADKICR